MPVDRDEGLGRAAPGGLEGAPRREADADAYDPREESGYDQPESSAQKQPSSDPRPERGNRDGE